MELAKITHALHNKFEVHVKDVHTGELKKKAFGYNLVLNSGLHAYLQQMTETTTASWYSISRFMRIANDQSTLGSSRFGNAIHIGSGSGTLSPTRTSLFTYTMGRLTDFHERGFDLEQMTAFYTQKMQLQANEFVGQTITEIGLAAATANGSNLRSHALLEDSEGNPISLGPKKDTEVYTFYATVYLTVTAPNTSVEYPGRERNKMLNVVSSNSGLTADHRVFSFGSMRGTVGKKGAAASSVYGALLGSKNTTVTKDLNNFKITHAVRLEVGECNGKIREIGLSQISGTPEFDSNAPWPVYRISLPAGNFESKMIVAENIATGDGETKKFNLNWDSIIANSDTIKLNGTPKSRGSDYTIHNGTKKGGNVLANCLISKDSSDSTGLLYALSNCFDGSTSTFSKIENQTSVFVFESAHMEYVDTFKDWRSSTGYNASSLKLEAWIDSAWIEICTISGGSSNTWRSQTFSEVSSSKFRITIVPLIPGNASSTQIHELQLLSSKDMIEFSSAPEAGVAISGDYSVDYIPKDSNHVLDVSCSITVIDANA